MTAEHVQESRRHARGNDDFRCDPEGGNGITVHDPPMLRGEVVEQFDGTAAADKLRSSPVDAFPGPGNNMAPRSGSPRQTRQAEPTAGFEDTVRVGDNAADAIRTQQI